MRATLLALALAMATPALASDADDALLDQTPMLESAKAAKTAAILAYPAVCNSTVPMQVLEAAALMARAHGGPLLPPVALAARSTDPCREPLSASGSVL
jgi:hypothetical protein